MIALKDKSRGSEKFKALAEQMETAVVPKWLEVNTQDLSAKVAMLPKREDVDFPFEEQLIIELYSK